MRKYELKYREFVKLLQEMDSLTNSLNLRKVLHFTTLNKFFLRMKGFILNLLFGFTIGSTSGDVSIDSAGFDRRYSSKHYVRRAKNELRKFFIWIIVFYRARIFDEAKEKKRGYRSAAHGTAL